MRLLLNSHFSTFTLNYSVQLFYHFIDMKTLTVTFLILCCHRCLGTLVVNLNGTNDTFLDFGKGMELSSPLTFCLRFNISDILETNYIFSSPDDELVLIFRFSVNLGILLINSVAHFFEIPKDHDVKPIHWHHICVTSVEDSYTVVLDGQQWYHANHSHGSFEKTTLTRLELGSTNKYWIFTDGRRFKGLLSGLNIWSKSLSITKMEEITTHCGKVDPIPDLLNWSELHSSIIRGSKYNDSIGNICPQTNATSTIYKIMPYLHDQDNARHVCKILNGELAFPNSVKELQTWKGKLLRMKCRNINNDFPLFSAVSLSENECLYFMAPMRRSSNGSWINQNNNRIVDMEFLWNSRSPNGGDLEKCTGFFADNCEYFDTPCYSKGCFICALKNTPLFTLRGLCTNTQVDNQFVLLPENTFDGNVFFFGFKENNILFNKETSSWLIVKNKYVEIFKPGGISTASLDVVGTFMPDQSNSHYLPVGTHFWNLTENCNKVLQLKLTQVRNEITLMLSLPNPKILFSAR